MKRFSALLTVLALLCALCACGSSKTGKDPIRDDSHGQTETPATREDDALTGSDSNSHAPAQPDDDTAEPDGGVSLDQMLRNGLVRDRDGDLSDGKTRLVPDLR